MKTKRIPTPDNWKDLKPHPLSVLVPYGAGIDTVKLAEHMREHGYDQSEPIVLLDGLILDGRHKHVGAQEADVVPTFAAFIGSDPIAYVKKKILRQHLSPSQRAMFAAELAKLSTSVVGENSSKNGGENGKPANLPVRDKDGSKLTQVEAAAALNVSERSVRDASRVSENSAALAEQVKAGEVSVSQAAQVIKTLFCERCNRTGPSKDCGKCEAIRLKAAKAKTPRAKKKAKNPRVGAEKFNWREFDSHFGHVARAPDKLAAAYDGEERSEEYQECDTYLRAFRKVWDRWMKRLSRVKEWHLYL